MSKPSISVIVPNYNHAQFLPRSLNALLSQSVPPCEIIVVNDASTDNSLEVLASFAKRYPIIRILSNEQNCGVNRSVNRGLALARGKYVFLTAADDEAKPGLFEHSMRLLNAHPEAGFCTALCEWRCASTNLSWHVGAGMPKAACYLTPVEMVELSRQNRLMISASNAVFRRTALLEASEWIPELRWFADAFATYVVGFRHGICYVPEVLSTFNLNPNSYYHTARSNAERRKVIEHFLALLESKRYEDVLPVIAASGILGSFGWPILRLTIGRQSRWRFLNIPLARRALRRCAEVVGRRFFPDWLARWCLKMFYRT